MWNNFCFFATVKLFTSILFISFSVIGFSQKPDTSIQDTGSITVIQEPYLETLLTTYKETYELTGYRIQVYSGTTKKESNQARASFLSRYPRMSTYEVYNAPNFKIRVGDFTNRFEALLFLEEIRNLFPAAYLVNDIVEFKPKKK